MGRSRLLNKFENQPIWIANVHGFPSGFPPGYEVDVMVPKVGHGGCDSFCL